MPKELWGNQLAVGYSAITREGTRNKLPYFETNGILDQVVIVYRDRILRYEVDMELTLTELVAGEEVCVEVQRLVETRDKEEFDEELLQELKK